MLNSVCCDKAGTSLRTTSGKTSGVSGIHITGIPVLAYDSVAMTIFQLSCGGATYLNPAFMCGIAVPDATNLRTHPRSDGYLELGGLQHLRRTRDEI